MKHLFLFFMVICGFLFAACKHSTHSPQQLLMVRYADSTYSQIADSIYIHILNSDTLYGMDDYPLNGYFHIYNSNPNVYVRGKYCNNNKVGVWKEYIRCREDEWYVDIIKCYNEQGKYHGPFIVFCREDTLPEMWYNFINGEEEGMQYKYYTTGTLRERHEIRNSIYVNEYLILRESGDTLFYVDLGEEGTGYIKEYEDELIYREGQYVRGKREGLFIIYNYRPYVGRCHLESIEYLVYRNDQLESRRIIHTQQDE